MHEIIRLLPEWLRDEAKDIEPDDWFDIGGAMALVGLPVMPAFHDVCIAVMPDPTGLGFQTCDYIPAALQGTGRA
ncbi:hypothetical protein DSM25559_1889 [Agrobacterium rosae]|uniref:Uncharacterized protein n=1 Tax=Agrobacterium rosae TaxID=1972867 RepID=A0A1R3TPQ6_9HYPH|nr:hypothetical protein DSM25559_1889 [Agrobacterium rosae]